MTSVPGTSPWRGGGAGSFGARPAVSLACCDKMSEEDIIDSEILISLIQAKPELWDKADENYKDRNKRRDAWKSICTQLKENF